MQNMTKSDVLAWWQSLQQQLSFAEGGRAMAQKELDSVQEDLADAIKEASQSLHRCSAYRLLTLQTGSREQSRGVSHATALDLADGAWSGGFTTAGLDEVPGRASRERAGRREAGEAVARGRAETDGAAGQSTPRRPGS